MTKIEYIDKYLEKLRRRLITTNNAFDFAMTVRCAYCPISEECNGNVRCIDTLFSNIDGFDEVEQ